MSSKKPTLTPREDRRRRALDVIMRTLNISDQEQSDRLARIEVTLKRSGVQAHRAGGVKLREDQIDAHAAALDIPALVFELAPTDVVIWLAENRSEQVFAASGWFSTTAHNGQHAA